MTETISVRNIKIIDNIIQRYSLKVTGDAEGYNLIYNIEEKVGYRFKGYLNFFHVINTNIPFSLESLFRFLESSDKERYKVLIALISKIHEDGVFKSHPVSCYSYIKLILKLNLEIEHIDKERFDQLMTDMLSRTTHVYYELTKQLIEDYKTKTL